MDIGKIIDEITPLYNLYKSNINISGTEALNIMWDIGDILKKYITKDSVAPHNLYRMVYGKSEGSNNITQKSRITREFQGRCFRIRNIFKTKSEITKELPNLKNFTTFREAMPFFDNKKYILTGLDKENLLELLNSKKDNTYIMKQIKMLQKEKIGIKNSRTQKLNELEAEKRGFISFYNLAFSILDKQDFSILSKNKITKEHLLLLSKNTNSLSQDGLKFSGMSLKETENETFNDYYKMINNFIEEKTPIKIRRFRRIITPERIVRLADILYALYMKIDKNIKS